MNLCADFLQNSACRQMKATGGCQKAWLPMSLACRAACHTGPCHDYGLGSEKVVAPLCADQSPKCFIWKILGQCKANPAYMLRGCPKSCGVCSTSSVAVERRIAKHVAECADFSPYCEDWMQEGHCAKSFVSMTCRKSCGVSPCKAASHIYMKTAATMQGDLRKLQNQNKALPQSTLQAVELGEGSSSNKAESIESTVWLKKSAKRINTMTKAREATAKAQKGAHVASGSKQIRGDIAMLKKSSLLKTKKTAAAAACKDAHPHCSHWAVTGQCRAHPIYMLRSCKKSCRRCNASSKELQLETQKLLATCADYHPDCGVWAERGDCRTHWLYMSLTCRATCKVGPCKAKGAPAGRGNKVPAKQKAKLSCKDLKHGTNGTKIDRFLHWACGMNTTA